MISRAYCQTMARYNAWQNMGLHDILEAMPDAELDRDRGAFFGSIRATLNHLLWADQLWMSRFDGGTPPEGGIADSTTLTPTIASWWADRFRTDGRIALWADKVKAVDLTGNLSWYSEAAGRDLSRPVAVCIAHFFNHQTHHRGQVHAMLTAAGLTPGDTDLPLMPET